MNTLNPAPAEISSSREPAQQAPRRIARPAFAAFLSLLLPGLGQIWCAQDNKGVFFLFLALLSYWLSGGLTSLLLCPALSVDAWLVARYLARGANATLDKWDFFPGWRPLHRLPPPRVAQLLAAATALIVLGYWVAYGWNYYPEE